MLLVSVFGKGEEVEVPVSGEVMVTLPGECGEGVEAVLPGEDDSTRTGFLSNSIPVNAGIRGFAFTL